MNVAVCEHTMGIGKQFEIYVSTIQEHNFYLQVSPYPSLHIQERSTQRNGFELWRLFVMKVSGFRNGSNICEHAFNNGHNINVANHWENLILFAKELCKTSNIFRKLKK